MRIFSRMMLVLIGLIAMPLSVMASDRFYCSGTEPFWSLVAAQDEFTFQISDKPTISFLPLKAMEMKYVTRNNLQVYKTKSQQDKKDATIIIQKMNCSDGMSSHKYDFQSIFIFDNTVYKGCCMRGEIKEDAVEQPAADDATQQ